MKKLEVSQATDPLEQYVRDLNEEPMMLTMDGKPVAALVPIDNADLETVTLSTNPKFLALIERSRTRQRTEGGVTSMEIRRRLGV